MEGTADGFINREGESLKRRFSQIIGHMNSTKNMLDNNKEKYDILLQLSAVEAATRSLRKKMMQDYTVEVLSDKNRNNRSKGMKKLDSIITQMFK